MRRCCPTAAAAAAAAAARPAQDVPRTWRGFTDLFLNFYHTFVSRRAKNELLNRVPVAWITSCGARRGGLKPARLAARGKVERPVGAPVGAPVACGRCRKFPTVVSKSGLPFSLYLSEAYDGLCGQPVGAGDVHQEAHDRERGRQDCGGALRQLGEREQVYVRAGARSSAMTRPIAPASC